jgi:uncharacterized protein with FMN-binding domain
MTTERPSPSAAEEAALTVRLEQLARRRAQPARGPDPDASARSRATAVPKRSRRHPAKVARYAAAGLSIASTVGLTSVFAMQAGGASQPVGTATVVSSSAAAGGTSGTAVSQAPSTASTGQSAVVDGAAFQNKWGVVQVEATFAADGSLASVTALQTPNDRDKSIRINDSAVPQLDADATSIQSAQVHTVSGATYTSNDYRRSLQSAIDAARAAGVTQLT